LAFFVSRTLLHMAAIQNDVHLARALALYHTTDDWERSDSFGHTPWHLAVTLGSMAVVRFLLRNPRLTIDSHAMTPTNTTILHQAIQHNWKLDVSMERLMHCPALCVVSHGWLPCEWALVCGRMKILKQLITIVVNSATRPRQPTTKQKIQLLTLPTPRARQWVRRRYCSGCGLLHYQQPSIAKCVCLKTRYCNRLCQRSHWSVHKVSCVAQSSSADNASSPI
jgi:ankyrin repeat protein